MQKLSGIIRVHSLQHPLVHISHKHGHKGEGETGPFLRTQTICEIHAKPKRNYIKGWLLISCHIAAKYLQSSRLIILMNTNNALQFFRTNCNSSSPNPQVLSDKVFLCKMMVLPTLEPWLFHWKNTNKKEATGKHLDP